MKSLIEGRELTIMAGNRVLLRKANFDIYTGEITLLVGGSGCGKTVLLKILARLIRPNTPHFRISGHLRLEGRELLHWRYGLRHHPVGIVFQDYGLLDEFSVLQNIHFAFAHSPFRIPQAERGKLVARLLKTLEIDAQLPLRHASGGQKRRIAIARTLAYNPEILIYDEPTAGLDPQLARNVAELVRKTHEQFGKKGSLIVTHQYEEFLPLVDRLLFFDPLTQEIRQVSAEQLQQLVREGRFQVPLPPLKPEGLLKRLGHDALKPLAATTDGLLRLPVLLGGSLLRLLPVWRSPWWGLRFAVHYLRLVSFLSAILYIVLSGAIIGFVSAYFTFQYLPYKSLTSPLITEDVLSAVGYGLYRVLIPVLISILVAARCGAAVASDVSNKVYLQEIDAMRSLGASPNAYLQTGIHYAFLLGLPFLTLLGFWVARAVSLGVFLYTHPQFNVVEADALFHKLLRQVNSPFFDGTQWVLAKTLVCGLGISFFCHAISIRPKEYARDISAAITLTVISATLFVLLVHFVFALLEFRTL